MPETTTQTDQVLASARKDLEAQLDVVREEIARLHREERALTQAVSSLNGGGSAATASGNGTGSAPTARPKSQRRTSTRKKASGRRGRRSGGKSTSERVEELRQFLAAGPKSRNDLAAALDVSPARVQQLLAELGGSVSSKPDPANARVKLWSLDGSANATNGGNSKATTGRRRSNSVSGRRRTPAVSATGK